MIAAVPGFTFSAMYPEKKEHFCPRILLDQTA
jgi:hypothetical protein